MSEASLVYILVTKVTFKNAKMIHLGEFLKTVLPDRSSLKGQKLVKNAKIEKFKCNILSNYQTW